MGEGGFLQIPCWILNTIISEWICPRFKELIRLQTGHWYADKKGNPTHRRACAQDDDTAVIYINYYLIVSGAFA